MKDEYIIINKTAIQKRIEKLEDESEDKDLTRDQYIEIATLGRIIAQSTPLIPEIEKAFGLGAANNAIGKPLLSDYISNLKLDI